MNGISRRHRSRAWESSILDAVLLLCMMVGFATAVLVLAITVGWAVGIFAF